MKTLNQIMNGRMQICEDADLILRMGLDMKLNGGKWDDKNTPTISLQKERAKGLNMSGLGHSEGTKEISHNLIGKI